MEVSEIRVRIAIGLVKRHRVGSAEVTVRVGVVSLGHIKMIKQVSKQVDLVNNVPYYKLVGTTAGYSERLDRQSVPSWDSVPL